jgi:hypothetical protein
MHRVTVKTSTIFIAKGGKTRVYHSVNEVPPRLRKQLEDSTNGFNSATNGLPSGLRSRLASSLAPSARAAAESKPSGPVQQFLRHNWAEVLLSGAGAAALVTWLLLHFR